MPSLLYLCKPSATLLCLLSIDGPLYNSPTQFGSGLMLVEGCVLVEAKAVEKIPPLHKAQLLGYIKLLDAPPGLLINFHEMKVTHGISRLILPGTNL